MCREPANLAAGVQYVDIAGSPEPLRGEDHPAASGCAGRHRTVEG